MKLLRVLDLQHNKLTSFPLSILRCEGLEELNLSGNKIEEIPADIYTKLTKLTKLVVEKCELKRYACSTHDDDDRIPWPQSQHAMKEMYLGYNKLILPDAFFNLAALEVC